MGKVNLVKLLILVAQFEQHTLRVFAQTPSKVPGGTFSYAIERLFGVKPTKEQWQNWLEVNSTVLGNLPWEYWGAGTRSIYHEVEFLPNREIIYAHITNTSAPPSPEFDATKVAVLRATSPIPTLWLQIGKIMSEPLSANVAHEAWLYEACKKLFGDNINKVFFSNFVAKNKNVINKIRRSFKVTIPKYLGGGADGAAFDIGEGRILKIFRDQVSYEKAQAAHERLYKNPPLAKTEAMIYDVGVLGRFGDSHSNLGPLVYYYIMEKMKTLGDFSTDVKFKILSILNFVDNEITNEKATKWRQIKLMILDPSKSEEVKKQVREASLKWASIYRRINKNDISYLESLIKVLKSNWLELYIEEILMKYLTGRTDLHMGNLGVTNYGELRYFDPAYSRLQSEINVG
jgi:hypothetical protein